MDQRHSPEPIAGTLVRFTAVGPAHGWPCCPHCHSSVNRVPRRAVDRLLSVFLPVRRYRCRAIACGWEGTLRNGHFKCAPGENAKSYNTRIDAL